MHLVHNSVQVPRLGFGTWQLTGQDCIEAIGHALSTGYRHIDTAQAYENEPEVGMGIARSGVPRDQIFLTTKVWRSNVGRLEESVDASLSRLGTDYVDLLLIHWPVHEVPLEEQLEALQAVQKAGKARLIGVSNYTVEWLNKALEVGVPLANNQVEYHPRLSQDPVLARVRSANMFLTAYSPLARGRLLDNPDIREIAGGHNVPPAAILLAWLLHQDDVAAIPKSTSKEHIEGNYAALDVTLSEDEMARITNLQQPDGRMIDPGFAPKWDTGVGQAV